MKHSCLALGLSFAALTLSLAACSSETGDGDQASGANLEQNDGWALTTSIDKFTDQQTAIAQRSFDVDGVRIDLSIKCAVKRAYYTFTAFDSSDEGLPFNTQSYFNQYAQKVITYTSLTVRVDDKPAIPPTASVGRYSNQSILTDGASNYGGLAEARRLLIRLRLIDRDVDLEIDQTTPNVAAALQECRAVPDTPDTLLAEDTLGDSVTQFETELPSSDPTAKEAILIDQYSDLNGSCRGGAGDVAATWHACFKRTIFEPKMRAANLCYGKDDQAGYQMEWHKCKLGSSGYGKKIKQPKKGRCLLRVSGKTLMSNGCFVELDDDGSFRIMSLDQKIYAAIARSSGNASGSWNMEGSNAVLDGELGEMSRSGACWKNESAEICAWKQ